MLPKVSILTPTKNREHFLRQCSKYIARQTYPHGLLQWVIVNGGEPLEFGFQPKDVSTVIVEVVASVGGMRNQGIRLASGDVIVHFDDDDWHADNRIEKQVDTLMMRGRELVCTDDYYTCFFRESPTVAHRSWSWGREVFSSGGTFAYLKSAWKKHPFAHLQLGEDYEFAKWIRMFRNSSTYNAHDPGLFVNVRHGNNTCNINTLMVPSSTTEEAERVRLIMGYNDFDDTVGLVRS